MTRFAADVFSVLAFGLEACVSSGAEVTRDIFVALRAFLGADKLRASDLRRGNNAVIIIVRSAGEKNYSKREPDPPAPK